MFILIIYNKHSLFHFNSALSVHRCLALYKYYRKWWYRQIPALSQDFQVIAFDNRGAGRSDKPAMEYSIRLFADDTAGLMDALDISKAHILGISMGGYIAQELALNYPAKIKSLVLGCTGCGGDRAVIMSPERMEKFMANKGLSPEEILRKDMDIYF
ncbi:MAG: alpha/beta fold hydrolase, partial [Desulfobacterales bacterium]